MLSRLAITTLLHEKEKLAAAATGVAIAVFLAIIQWGFYFGYRQDITVVIDAYDADIWIIPKISLYAEGAVFESSLAGRAGTGLNWNLARTTTLPNHTEPAPRRLWLLPWAS